MKKFLLDLNELDLQGLKAYIELLKQGATEITPKAEEGLHEIPEPPKQDFNV